MIFFRYLNEYYFNKQGYVLYKFLTAKGILQQSSAFYHHALAKTFHTALKEETEFSLRGYT